MKILTLILLLGFTSLSYSQQDTAVNNIQQWELKADSILATAKTQLGVPYKYATSKKNVSFDCSGFTSFVYGKHNVTNMRTSKGYGNLGEKIAIEECRKGDVILFTGTDASNKSIGHVGIIVENDENGITFIHCSSSRSNGGVVISSLSSPNYTRRFLMVRRIF